MAVATFTASGFGQRFSDSITPAPVPVYPHDFSDSYYTANGVKPAGIKDRLTGTDGLSVFEKTANPNYTNVRALVTMPAYTETGEFRFWTPLGTVNINYLSDQARNLATRHVVYVFQFPTMQPGVRPLANLRQAVIFDDASSGYVDEVNPLGLRFIVNVEFVAPTTTKQKIVLEEMANRNGRAADGNPLVKSLSDLNTLRVYDLIVFSKGTGEVAIAPLIDKQSLIAKDAFLLMAMKDGKPLDGETHFTKKFECRKSSVSCD
jgi:hypothetical protein